MVCIYLEIVSLIKMNKVHIKHNYISVEKSQVRKLCLQETQGKQRSNLDQI